MKNYGNKKKIFMKNCYQVFKDSKLIKIVYGNSSELLDKLLELEHNNPNSRIRFIEFYSSKLNKQ
jgi:hypothetical protein